MGGGDPARTVVALSDSHAGDARYDARLDAALDDLASLPGEPPLAFLHGGDLADAPRADLARGAAAKLTERLPAAWHGVPGNHDLCFGGEGQSAEAWAAASGLSAESHVADLGPFAVVCLYAAGVGRDDVEMLLGDEDLAFLDDALRTAGKPCIVLSHAPLADTVRGAPDYYDSTMPTFAVTPSPAVREILARHDTAVAWLSGHTHSDPGAPDWCKAERVGDHTVAAISIPALAFTGLQPSAAGDDPLLSLAVTLTGATVEVRVRDHRAHAWRAPLDIPLS